MPISSNILQRDNVTMAQNSGICMLAQAVNRVCVEHGIRTSTSGDDDLPICPRLKVEDCFKQSFLTCENSYMIKPTSPNYSNSCELDSNRQCRIGARCTIP